MLKPSFQSLVRNWWLVVVWLGVIRMESTDTASAANTTVVLYKVIAVVVPHVEPSFVQQLDEVLRKSGHFLGYGILSVLVFLALRNTNRDRLRPLLQRPWGIYLSDLWRAEWVLIGMLTTIVTASFDEIHQTFIPSRTGRWQDVVLDTVGAAALQIAVYLLSRRVLKQSEVTAPQPELTSTR
ncbi:MAG: VanZ family protein [Candidatus Korobacteraceae bacterium]